LSFTSVRELISRGELPKEVADIIPVVCEYCGSDIIISDNLKRMYCTEDCPRIIANKMEKFLKELGVNRFGPAVCFDIVFENELRYPYQVLDLDVDGMPQRYSFEVRSELYMEIESVRQQKLSKVVKAMQLDGIADSANKLFDETNDIREFFDILDADGEDFIAD